MTERRGHYDLLGIGLGPFNLGLAALLDDCETNAVFLDEQSSFSWHGGMQIEGTSLEVPFLADMVSLADPTSEYSYLNYLRETGRIYEFYFYETFQIPRREYEAYMQWVSERLDTTRFSRRVTTVDHRDGTFVVTAADPETGGEYVYTADDIALGVGSRPFVPEEFRELRGPSFFHTAGYRDRRADVLDADSITVVGSGQSGAEVVLDLLDHQPDHGYRVDWLTRSDGFFPMEYSKLGLQHFTPEYAQYFYDLPDERKDEIRTDQDLLYKGIDVDTSAAIYDQLYERSIGDRVPEFGMLAMTAVTDVTPMDDGYRLACRQHQQDERFVHDTDVVVLATGYHRPTPSFLDPVRTAIDFDDEGRYRVTEDYRLETGLDGQIFVQNADLHTHGVGAPDLGLGCYRNAVIVEQLAGETVYPIDRDTVFQQFDVARFCEDAPARRRRPTTTTQD